MEIISIPGGETFLAITDIFFGDVDLARDRIRLADTVGPATLRNGVAKLDDTGTG
jgi:hypothetical protein